MKNTNIYVLSAVIVALVTIGAVLFFVIRNKAVVLEYRDFSCDKITGFTFRYPVFKGWEVLGTRWTQGNECVVFISDKILRDRGINTEVAPGIFVRKIMPSDNKEMFAKNTASLAQNPHGVLYENKNFNELIFYTNDFAAEILMMSIPDKFGFSVAEFKKEVIKSFRLITAVGG